MADDWMFLPDEATPLMLAAVRAYGLQALTELATDVPLTAENCGNQLQQIVLGGREADGSVAHLLAQLVRDPVGNEGKAELKRLASEVFDNDPAATARAVGLIYAYHRGRADGGEVQALVDLGDFLYWDRPEEARAAFRRRSTPGICAP